MNRAASHEKVDVLGGVSVNPKSEGEAKKNNQLAGGWRIETVTPRRIGRLEISGKGNFRHQVTEIV